jgi:hypothetical protein
MSKRRSKGDNPAGAKRRRSENRGQERQKFVPAWKRAQDLPAFLDASASVAASTFGARRLPEIKSLWNASLKRKGLLGPIIPTEEPLKSCGGKTSSRHLRRRTTSHNSRKRHRYPDPSSIRTDDFPAVKKASAATAISRRSKRKNKAALSLPHESWWRRTDPKTSHATSISSDNPQKESNKKFQKQAPLFWIPTHLWHCKRFHMANLWGWKIPMVHSNRGPKAALRLIREGKTLLQDSTWKMGIPIIIQSIVKDEVLVPTLCRICPEFQMKSVDSTACIGQGLAYGLDQFPQKAIGPVEWFVSQGKPLVGTEETNYNSDSSQCSYINFWVHPSIQSALFAELKKLEREKSVSAEPQPFQSLQLGSQKSGNTGAACLKLRGINATITIQKVLASRAEIKAPAERSDILRILKDNNLHTSLPHGSVLAASVSLDSASSSSSSSSDVAAGDQDSRESTNVSGCWVGGNRILLISHCIRDSSNLPQNAPAIGWDIFCDVSIAKDLFVKLVLAGQACPIGVVEEAYVNLECAPPIATVFPRDYPETEEGRRYWHQMSQGESDENNGVLRICLEEGEAGGRVPVPTISHRVRSNGDITQPRQQQTKISVHHLSKIRWNRLLTGTASEEGISDEDEGTEEVVVMRGIFGKPLLDALSGCGTVPSRRRAEDSPQPKRRKRRRVKQSGEILHALPLAPDQVETHQATCRTLIETLSLPAVVACHLLMIGSGTIAPGAEIRSISNDAHLLGFVTAGTFSVARGRCHGIGVVAAAPLLHALLWASANPEQAKEALAVVEQPGTGSEKVRQLHLQVQIRNCSVTYKASLSLML